jgi:hypothetical protein
LRYPIPDRTLVIEYLKLNNYQFPYDFVCYEDKLITFHNLNNDELSFRSVIDYGTVTPIPSQNFYKINNEKNENRERVFKDLLRRCLVRMLKKHGVDWQEDEKLFIFTMNERDDSETITFNAEKNRYERRVAWVRERLVCFRKMNAQRTAEVLFYQHLAFSGRFYHLEGKWYLQINPNWFFSSDGYRKTDYLNYYLKWLKREEVNTDVKNDFRFVVWFFKDRMGHLFDESFIKFSEPKFFSGSPELLDELWSPPKPKIVENEESKADEEEVNVEENETQPTLFDVWGE